jgi:hypothetical protein
MVIKLKEVLARDNFSIEEKDLKIFYEKNKNKRYQRQPSVKVNKLSVHHTDNKLNGGLLSKQEAQKLIRELKLKLAQGINFESFKNNRNIFYEIQLFNDSTAAVDEKVHFQLRTVAFALLIGETSPIIEDENGFHIIKCLDNKDGSNIPFDEIKSIVRSDYIEKKYQDMLEKLISDAEININHAVYDSIRVR